MALPIALLSTKQAKEIKSLLWAGHLSQPEIAALYKTHQTGVSQIMNGLIWKDAEWPNGDIGCIDPERHRVITSSRKRSSRYANPKQEGKPSEATAKVLERIHRITDSSLGTGKGHIEIARYGRDMERSGHAARRCNHICRLDPYHTVVRQLKAGGPDSSLKTALGYVLQEIPLNEWSRKSVIAAIYQLSHFIKNTP